MKSAHTWTGTQRMKRPGSWREFINTPSGLESDSLERKYMQDGDHGSWTEESMKEKEGDNQIDGQRDKGI